MMSARTRDSALPCNHCRPPAHFRERNIHEGLGSSGDQCYDHNLEKAVIELRAVKEEEEEEKPREQVAGGVGDENAGKVDATEAHKLNASLKLEARRYVYGITSRYD